MKKHPTGPLCVAYLKSGVRCNEPASFVNPTVSGLVCSAHRLPLVKQLATVNHRIARARRLPLAPAPAAPTPEPAP